MRPHQLLPHGKNTIRFFCLVFDKTMTLTLDKAIQNLKVFKGSGLFLQNLTPKLFYQKIINPRAFEFLKLLTKFYFK